VGELLGDSTTSDVVDASLVELARDGDEILTFDVGDLARLADAAGKTPPSKRRGRHAPRR
jgi:uncharacterized protein YaiI (UPF0178 family)